MKKKNNLVKELNKHKKIFTCSCHSHLIEISYTELKFKKGKIPCPELAIAIYEVYGGKSGRKLKKPKLIGDVVFLGEEPYTKEMDNIMKFLEDITMQYMIRKK